MKKSKFGRLLLVAVLTLLMAFGGIVACGESEPSECSFAFTFASYTYGESASTPIITEEAYDGAVVSYLYEGRDGTVYSSEVAPTLAGSYKVTGSIEATEKYKATEYSVEFTVNKATPTVSANPTASGLTYGQTLAGCTLSGGVASVEGAFAFEDSSIATEAGEENYIVVFTPTDTANYNTVSVEVTVLTAKATPTVSVNPTAGGLIYGQTLADCTLSGGVASVEGTFAFEDSSIATEAGEENYTVVFTPTDTDNYNSVTVSIPVLTAQTENTFAFTFAGYIYGASASTPVVTEEPFEAELSDITYKFVGREGTVYDSEVAPTLAGKYTVIGTVPATSNYIAKTFSVDFEITKASASEVIFPTANGVTYGVKLSTIALNGGSTTGAFAWKNGDTVPTVVNEGYEVVFTPTDKANYDWSALSGYDAQSGNIIRKVSIEVAKATPTVSANPTASGITYGAKLSTSTLTGGEASVEGAFAWKDGNTVPTVANEGYKVVFTPNDTANYNSVEITVAITVAKATPVVSANPTASGITYGAKLSTSALSGGTASVEGTYAWKDGNTVPTVANEGYKVVFTPNDTANYNAIEITVAITVAKATPTVSANPTASGITYGAKLSTSALSGGTASVEGAFAWKDGNTVPTVANEGYKVVFTPNDTANYNAIEITVAITVAKATPTVSTNPTASGITYGAKLSTSTLTGGEASVEGAYAWKDGNTVPTVANDGYKVVFTPNDTANYNSVEITVAITVAKASVTLTAPTAVTLNEGESLSTVTLSGGTASVEGSWAWADGSVVPSLGESNQTAKFTPASDNYQADTVTVSVTVIGNLTAQRLSAEQSATLSANAQIDLATAIAITVEGKSATAKFSALEGEEYAFDGGKIEVGFGGKYKVLVTEAVADGVTYRNSEGVIVEVTVETEAIEEAQTYALLRKATGELDIFAEYEIEAVDGYEYTYTVTKNTRKVVENAVSDNKLNLALLNGMYQVDATVTHSASGQSKAYFSFVIDAYKDELDMTVISASEMLGITGKQINPTVGVDGGADPDPNDDYFVAQNGVEGTYADGVMTFAPNGWLAVGATPVHSKAYYEMIKANYTVVPDIVIEVTYNAENTSALWPRGLLYLTNSSSTVQMILNGGMNPGTTYKLTVTLDQFIDAYDDLSAWYEIAHTVNGEDKQIENNTKHSPFFWAAITGQRTISLTDFYFEGEITSENLAVTVNDGVTIGENTDYNLSEILTITVGGKKATEVEFEIYGTGYTLEDGVFNSAFNGSYNIKVVSAVVDGTVFYANGDALVTITVEGNTFTEFENKSILIDKSAKESVDIKNSADNGGITFDEIPAGYQLTYALYSVDGSELTAVDGGITADGVIDTTALEGMYRAVAVLNKDGATKDYFTLDIDIYDGSVAPVVLASLDDLIAFGVSDRNNPVPSTTIATTSATIDGREVKTASFQNSVGTVGMALSMKIKHSKAYYQAIIDSGITTFNMELYSTANGVWAWGMLNNGDMANDSMLSGIWYTQTVNLSKIVDNYDYLLEWYKYWKGEVSEVPATSGNNLLFSSAVKGDYSFTGAIYSQNISPVIDSPILFEGTTYTVPGKANIDTDNYYYYTSIGDIMVQGTSVDVSSLANDVYLVKVIAYEKNTGVKVGLVYSTDIIVGGLGGSISYAMMTTDAIMSTDQADASTQNVESIVTATSDAPIGGRINGTYYKIEIGSAATQPGFMFNAKNSVEVYNLFKDGYVVFDYYVDKADEATDFIRHSEYVLNDNVGVVGAGWYDKHTGDELFVREWHRRVLPVSRIVSSGFQNFEGSYGGQLFALGWKTAGLYRSYSTVVYISDIKVVNSLDAVDEQVGFTYASVGSGNIGVGQYGVAYNDQVSIVNAINESNLAGVEFPTGYSTTAVYKLDCSKSITSDPYVRIKPTLSNDILKIYTDGYNLQFSYFVYDLSKTETNFQAVSVSDTDANGEAKGNYLQSKAKQPVGVWNTVSVSMADLTEEFYSKNESTTHNGHAARLLQFGWDNYSTSVIYVTEIRVVPAQN